MAWSVGPVAELLTALRIPFITSGHHHCTPGWLQLKDCPSCGPDGYRLGVHATWGAASCWSCGKQDPVRVLSLLSGKPPGPIRKEFVRVRKTGGQLPSVEHVGTYRVPFPVGKLLRVHRSYLRSRGFDPKQVQAEWGIGGVGLDGGRWQWRVFIPVHLDGKPVSWVTRSVSDTGTRYLSAKPEWEAVRHKDTLYGFDKVRSSCLVVEGPTGVWRCGPGSVATFGVVWEESQVALLAQVPRKYVMFDPEPVARRQAERLCERLSGMGGVVELVHMPEGTDPGRLTPKQVRRVRRWIG